MGKKRFMAQGLPLELFADRKIKKWQARAAARGIRLVDGVGTSPMEEMIYIWSMFYNRSENFGADGADGYKRMDSAQLEVSLRAIRYAEDKEQDLDEQAIRQLLESVVYRRMGQLDKTKELLNKVLQATLPRGTLFDEWMGIYTLETTRAPNAD
jgi:hypothetical protein